MPKEIKNILISAYSIGYWDRDAKLSPFNQDEDKLDYLQSLKEAQNYLTQTEENVPQNQENTKFLQTMLDSYNIEVAG